MRGPTAPVSFLALWLGFAAATGQHHRDKVVAFRLDVPREQWLQFLAPEGVHWLRCPDCEHVWGVETVITAFLPVPPSERAQQPRP